MTIGVRWGSVTHGGRVRTVNQDSVLAGPSVFAVADGMGGHAAGEVASAMAVARLAELPAQPSAVEVVAAIVDANAQIRGHAAPGSGREGMGTTLAGVVLAASERGEGVLVFNVGDSRAYRLGVDGLEQVSADHSVVAEMVRSGELEPDEASGHPSRHVVTRALGIGPEVEVDRWWLEAVPGDRFLVCSDGLTNEVDEAEIAAVLAAMAIPQAAADHLLRSALSAGARDNVSVVIVHIDQVLAAGSAIDEDTNPTLVRGGGVTSTVIDSVPGVPATLGAEPGADGEGLITGVPSLPEVDEYMPVG